MRPTAPPAVTPSLNSRRHARPGAVDPHERQREPGPAERPVHQGYEQRLERRLPGEPQEDDEERHRAQRRDPAVGPLHPLPRRPLLSHRPTATLAGPASVRGEGRRGSVRWWTRGDPRLSARHRPRERRRFSRCLEILTAPGPPKGSSRPLSPAAAPAPAPGSHRTPQRRPDRRCSCSATRSPTLRGGPRSMGCSARMRSTWSWSVGVYRAILATSTSWGWGTTSTTSGASGTATTRARSRHVRGASNVDGPSTST